MDLFAYCGIAPSIEPSSALLGQISGYGMGVGDRGVANNGRGSWANEIETRELMINLTVYVPVFCIIFIVRVQKLILR